MVRIWRAGDQLSVNLSALLERAPRTLDRDGFHVRTFQDVKADAAKLVDVGMEYLGEEADLGRRHGIVVGKEQLQLERAT
jgi:hypothetical protein